MMNYNISIYNIAKLIRQGSKNLLNNYIFYFIVLLKQQQLMVFYKIFKYHILYVTVQITGNYL